MPCQNDNNSSAVLDMDDHAAYYGTNLATPMQRPVALYVRRFI